MLEYLRTAAKGWVAKIFLGLLVVSFAVWGIADVFTGGGSRGALATVGAKEITAEEFDRTFTRALQQYSQQLGENINRQRARELGIDRQILADMLRGRAVEAQAGNLKLAVSDQMIVDEIAKNPAFQDSSGKFDPAALRRVLEQAGLSEAGFIAGERGQMLSSAIADTVDADFAAPSVMVEAMFRHENEQRDIRYFVVKAAEADVAQPADADIKAFHEDNKGRYTAPEYRGIAIMKAEPADIAARINVTDDDVKTAYDKYKPDYFIAETRTILQVTFATLDDAKKAKARVDAGENFAKIGEERGLKPADMVLSTGKKTDIIDSIIADAAFALKEGEVSAPVEGKLSIVLLKAAAIAPEKQQTLDEVRVKLTERLKLEGAAEELKSIYDTVDDAIGQRLAFEDIAKTAGIPFILIPAVDANGDGKDGKTVEIPEKSEVLKLAFASDAGEENAALSTTNDGFIWYQVRDIAPSALRPLDTVKDKVKADLIAKRVRELAVEKAAKLRDRAQAGTPLDDLAKEANAEVKSLTAIKRKETSAEMDAAAVSALFAAPDKGFATAPEGDGKGAKVMEVTQTLTPKFDAASKEAETLATSLNQAAAADLSGLYVSGLQQALGTTVNETLWRQITGETTN